MLSYKDFLNRELIFTFEAADPAQACAAADAYLKALEAEFIRRNAGKNLRPGRKWFRALEVVEIE